MQHTLATVKEGEIFKHKNEIELDFIYFCSRTKMTEGFSTSPAEKFFFFHNLVSLEYKLKVFLGITKDNYSRVGIWNL